MISNFYVSRSRKPATNSAKNYIWHRKYLLILLLIKYHVKWYQMHHVKQLYCLL